MLNATTVVNVKTDEYDLYIGRANATYGLPASKWANPFRLEREQDRPIVLARYRLWLLSQPSLMRALPELRGLRLGCWCKQPGREVLCHGDVLAALANSAAANDAQPRPAGAEPVWADASIRAYWATELALGSPALERLARVCAEQGWGYRETVEGLR